MLSRKSFYWINACFQKKDHILRKSSIINVIFEIFSELYNIFALASKNKTIPQPNPKLGIFKHAMIYDPEDSKLLPETKRMREVSTFISGLSSRDTLREYYFPKKSDQYLIKRVALEYNLKPFRVRYKNREVTIYSEKRFHSKDLKNYSSFLKIINGIKNALKQAAIKYS